MFRVLSPCRAFLANLRMQGWETGIKVRGCQSEARDPEVIRIRRLKRLFAFGLFGSTLLIGLAAKRQRRNHLEPIFSEATRLGTFGVLPIYQYRKYVLAEPVLKIIDRISSFRFRESDVVLISFPKTGMFAVCMNSVQNPNICLVS